MAEDEDQETAAALAKLAEQDPAAAEDARAALEWIAGEQGRAFITQERIQGFCWYERIGEPPDEHHIGCAIHETSNLCRALGLLAVGGDWRDRSYGLTSTGQATGLAALRARATGPRTIPWP
jgi:hypothetical protein